MENKIIILENFIRDFFANKKQRGIVKVKTIREVSHYKDVKKEKKFLTTYYKNTVVLVSRSIGGINISYKLVNENHICRELHLRVPYKKAETNHDLLSVLTQLEAFWEQVIKL